MRFVYFDFLKQGTPLIVVVVASKETKAENVIRLSAVAERVRAAEAAAAAAAAGGDEEGDAGDAKKGKDKKSKGKEKKGKGAVEEEESEGAGSAFDPGSVLTVYEVWPKEPMFVAVASLETERTITSVVVSRGSAYISVTHGTTNDLDIYSLPVRFKSEERAVHRVYGKHL